MGETIDNDEASIEREQQRSESEARDIIHDVDRLYSLAEEKKTRWVWELLQNAKDVAPLGGTDIEIKLTPEKLEFKHNGLPFKTKHLLAILYKTSTKSLNGEGGTTGKYGTGFVTTHILNKRLSISGIHENDRGERNFNIEIDRTPAQLEEDKALAAMQESLKKTFISISEITKSPAVQIENRWHSFTYLLKPDSYVYAERGLLELERNLAFLLLINSKIKSIVINTTSAVKTYIASYEDTSLNGIRFVSLGDENGLLYKKTGKLIFGIPSAKTGETYRLMPIENQAILFKEFPLIGTENFNLPVFIQHEDFHPTELRDAIRTKLSSDSEPDPIAEKNRQALIEFKNAYLIFITELINAELEGSYLFAKSGLPEYVNIFSNSVWYSENIQTPIRDTILKENIVTPVKGTPKKISEAKFILGEFVLNDAFFDLAGKLIPQQLPDKNSIWQWSEIIAQEPERWPSDIVLKIESFLELIPAAINLDEDESFEWLKKLYSFLDDAQLIHLGEKYPIYPSEAGDFCIKDDLSIHPDIDAEFKIVSKGLGRPLEKEFLDKRVGKLSTIKPFDLTDFYKQLNSELIGDLKVESASEDAIKAVFHVCCLFRSDRAYRRESWFKIINQLLPDMSPVKITISVDYENYGRSAELWTIKYICTLIEKVGKPSEFVKEYFEGHKESCFEWLTDFISFAFGLAEDSREVILKRNIIAVQSDEFRPYEDFIFSEQEPKLFTDSLKDIYKNYTSKGDPRKFIVDTKITSDEIRPRDAEALTKEIDKLFLDENIESKVRKGGALNEMFLQLNDWFEGSGSGISFLPTFAGKRATLYVLALGEGFSKQIMEIRNSGKSMEDITELAKIQLTVDEMKLLESAAKELGTEQLLAKAREMLDSKLQIERWKTIGTTAETAFTDALSFTQPEFQILNPDIGKDFVIIANGKEYAIEIKSVDAGKGNVNMSLLQGATSVLEKDRYSLCVLSRPVDNIPVDKDYFMNEARFVPNIGYKIGNSIERWNLGIRDLDTNQEVKVAFDEKSESVYVNRNIWNAGITFEEFCGVLENYFK